MVRTVSRMFRFRATGDVAHVAEARAKSSFASRQKSCLLASLHQILLQHITFALSRGCYGQAFQLGGDVWLREVYR